jgi:hypothetical protein
MRGFGLSGLCGCSSGAWGELETEASGGRAESGSPHPADDHRKSSELENRARQAHQIAYCGAYSRDNRQIGRAHGSEAGCRRTA